MKTFALLAVIVLVSVGYLAWRKSTNIRELGKCTETNDCVGVAGYGKSPQPQLREPSALGPPKPACIQKYSDGSWNVQECKP